RARMVPGSLRMVCLSFSEEGEQTGWQTFSPTTSRTSSRTNMCDKSIYDFMAESLDGQSVPLSKYRGKVLLIVNLATF
uniref:Glutathione peroxidase n=1 Tax=Gadus morhua TaxID=8049 RepID=A0A8C5ALG1_GADMO